VADRDHREGPALHRGPDAGRHDRDRSSGMLGHLVRGAAQPKRLVAARAAPADHDQVRGNIVRDRQERGRGDTDHDPVVVRRGAPTSSASSMTRTLVTTASVAPASAATHAPAAAAPAEPSSPRSSRVSCIGLVFPARPAG
jgi:hypothetical protein